MQHHKSIIFRWNIILFFFEEIFVFSLFKLTELVFFFLVLVCGLTIPALYERYEEEVDRLASRGSHDLKEFFRRVDSRVLERIPRGPAKRKSN